MEEEGSKWGLRRRGRGKVNWVGNEPSYCFVGSVRVWYRGKREGVAERRVRSELELKDERRSLRSCERARVPLDVCFSFYTVVRSSVLQFLDRLVA